MPKNYGNNSQLAELVKYISDTMKLPVMGAGGGFAPIGTINFFDATTAPLGWLACDGSTHNISDYPDLATFYASQHGASNFYGGNGTTTFAVPNLQGEFLRGAGTNGHTNQGNGGSVGEHQDATNLPYGEIKANENKQLQFLTNSAINYDQFVANPDSSFNLDTSGTLQYIQYTKDGGGSTSSTTYRKTIRPTNTSFLICVKATVSGDANAHQYSTEEQVVGKWIDGSDIYEKTFYNVNLSTTFNANVGAGEGTFTDNSLSDIDIIFECKIIGKLDSQGNVAICNTANAQHRTSTSLFLRTPSDNNYIQHITIQYTKTQ